MNIKHIFFDLDHTLWDFDKNSKLTFKQIIEEQGVKLNVDEFLNIYLPINLKYWKLYRDEKVSKSTLRYGRLKETFDALNYKISDDLISIISEDYIKYLPNYNHLFEGTVEVLEYLKQKYELHIITNGFEEVQNLKMQKAGIDTYFKEVITSESVGVKKPNPKVFEFALMKAETIAKEAIMIGDSYEADILGALNCGMLAIHFTNETTPKKGVINIQSLIQLKQYL
ncbi:YjjG family noncanonical pyrimidine nucleotidase [Tenacibaculum sp. HL-MS23]|uniref:YjjG family noncanonical pyrimidine nucleotidase n=1 Tax=Tenacibaculum sp. HL-MS23 TaxID=3077734 RepID=UPI0028FC172E|nr:YjjG family noncanonical pyrimidine nucleotidase [Tenacibaculum sp. HL-MS23]WNW02945.1 YjjG family noncanonical pyrimidine nucleotidase [Tenacibaculum sp. HL-MS23]